MDRGESTGTGVQPGRRGKGPVRAQQGLLQLAHSSQACVVSFKIR